MYYYAQTATNSITEKLLLIKVSKLVSLNVDTSTKTNFCDY